MLNAKKVLKKAAAAVTCVAMLAGNGLSAFAGNVTLDPDKFDHIVDEGKDFYAYDTPSYWVTMDGEEILIVSSEEGIEELGLDKDSLVIVGDKVYIIEESDYVDETKESAYLFVYAGKYDDWFGESEGDDYITRLGKKIREIYMAQVNKSLNYNNHVEYNEGDGIRYDMMEALSNTKGVVLDFYFTYKGVHYHATITSEKAQAVYKKEIEVYGPQFILANFPCEVMNYDTK